MKSTYTVQTREGRRELFQRNPSRNLKIDLCDTLRSDIMSKMLRNIPRHIKKLLAQTEGKFVLVGENCVFKNYEGSRGRKSGSGRVPVHEHNR